MECSSPFTKREQKHWEPCLRIYGNSLVSFEQNPLHVLTTALLTSVIATLSVIANNYSRSGKKIRENKQSSLSVCFILSISV